MTSLDALTEATLLMLREAVRESDMPMTGDGRVREADAAQLLGYDSRYLKQLRQEGRGPPAYGLGMAGGRVSYRLSDLAAWIESRRENFDEADS